MKMSAACFERLSSLIDITPELIESYEQGAFCNAHKVKDLNLRFRFDLFNHAFCTDRVLRDMIRDEDLTNDHVDTAMRKIVPKISRHY